MALCRGGSWFTTAVVTLRLDNYYSRAARTGLWHRRPAPYRGGGAWVEQTWRPVLATLPLAAPSCLVLRSTTPTEPGMHPLSVGGLPCFGYSRGHLFLRRPCRTLAKCLSFSHFTLVTPTVLAAPFSSSGFVPVWVCGVDPPVFPCLLACGINPRVSLNTSRICGINPPRVSLTRPVSVESIHYAAA